MPKKLIICADGTWNTQSDTDSGHPSPTNVVKIERALLPRDAKQVQQVVFPIDGVGTSFGTFLRGGTLGRGLFANVQKCYQFLRTNYEPGDQLYFFGFSRGAFTVHSLAGLVRNSGILRRGEEKFEEEALGLYRDYNEDTQPDAPKSVAFRRDHSHEAMIDFIGVWDTVGSLGIPGLDGRFRILRGLDWQFHDVTLSKIVRRAHHALAIHEHRLDFVPTLWEQGADATAEQVLEQVWFSGVHSDVGGGYAIDVEEQGRLSDVTLEWMIDKAKAAGLEFDDSVLTAEYDYEPNALADGHDSFKGFFAVRGSLTGHQGGALRAFREKPQAKTNESIHPSVRARFEKYPDAGQWPPGFLNELSGK